MPNEPQQKEQNMNITIDNDTLVEKLERMFANRKQRKLPVPLNEHPEAWLRKHREDLQVEMESQLVQALQNMLMTDEERHVTKPVLEFKRPQGGHIRLYVYRAGQLCYTGEHHQFHFGHDGQAGLVYDEQTASGHNAQDIDVDNPSTWLWIQEWMIKGMVAEGVLPACGFSTGDHDCMLQEGHAGDHDCKNAK